MRSADEPTRTGTASTGTGPQRLLDPDLIRTLERLSLVSHKRLAGRMAGDRRSPRRGAGIEFADFREYAPGDDFRRVDWNLYARCGKLFLKLYSLDEDRTVSILVDCTRSMDFGEPAKGLYSRRAAAALAYLALAGMDRVKVVALRQDENQVLGPLRGRAQFRRVLEWLETLSCDGTGGLGQCLRRFTAAERYPGLAFVLSDFMEEGLPESLRGFGARGFETAALQVLSPQDLHPELAGDLRLVDAESQDELEVTVTSFLLNSYQKALKELQDGLRAECLRSGLAFMTISTATPLTDLFSRVLPAGGVVA